MSNKPFDIRTHIRHPKSGRVIAENHYSLKVEADAKNGTVWLFERPVGSGLYYYRNGAMDMERSAEGLKRKVQADADRNKTEFEKAKEAYDNAQANLNRAKNKLELENRQKAKKAEE